MRDSISMIGISFSCRKKGWQERITYKFKRAYRVNRACAKLYNRVGILHHVNMVTCLLMLPLNLFLFNDSGRKVKLYVCTKFCGFMGTGIRQAVYFVCVVCPNCIYFLLRDGDPSLRIFLSCCDSSAGRSDARCLWLRVLRGEIESKSGRGR